MTAVCSGCSAVASLTEVTLGSLTALQTLNARALALEEVVGTLLSAQHNYSMHMTNLQRRITLDEHSRKSDIDNMQVILHSCSAFSVAELSLISHV